MNKDRLLALIVGVIVILSSLQIYNYFVNDPLRNLQSLADSISSQLVSRISSASVSSIDQLKPSSVFVVWSDSGKICTDIQNRIPQNYWPKTIDDFNEGYLISITKTTGDKAEYGTYSNSFTGYQVVYFVRVIICYKNQDAVQKIVNVTNKSFYGEELPHSISKSTGDKSSYYGPPPSSDSIIDWISTTLINK
jgi:hypothetical protein